MIPAQKKHGQKNVIVASEEPSNTSRQVDFFSVHLHVKPLLDSVGSWPMVGTPGWLLLDDRDPVKLAAICDASRHWALRVQINQVAMAEASRAIREAADWKSVANLMTRQTAVYIPRVKETV